MNGVQTCSLPIFHFFELVKRQRDIKAALEKMDKGTYGTCEVCDEPILKKRLEANPAARTCIAHA